MRDLAFAIYMHDLAIDIGFQIEEFIAKLEDQAL